MLDVFWWFDWCLLNACWCRWLWELNSAPSCSFGVKWQSCLEVSKVSFLGLNISAASLQIQCKIVLLIQLSCPITYLCPEAPGKKNSHYFIFQMNKTPVVIKWLILLLFYSSNNQKNKHFLSLRQICTYFVIYAFSTFLVILLCSLLFSVACKAGLRKYRNTNIVHLMVVCLEANLHIHTTTFAVFITTQLYLSRTPIFILNLGLLRSTPIYNT